MGPYAIRYAGLEARLRALGYEVTDQGNVPAPVVESVALEDHSARYLPEVKATCERIASRVWGRDDPADLESLRVFIRRLRAKLGDDAADPRYIETLRGVGYRLVSGDAAPPGAPVRGA